MLKRGRIWFNHLSSAGKIGTVMASVFCLLVVGSAIANPQSSQACNASTTIKTEVEPISYDKTNVNDSNLDKGKTAITTKGVDGEKEITKKVTTYSPDDCKPSETTVTSEKTTKAAVAEVTNTGTKEPAPKPAPTPTPAPAAAPAASSSSCSPYYSPCVPNVSYDLDCPDIGMRVSVHGGDPYRFDADHDGIGCESY